MSLIFTWTIRSRGLLCSHFLIVIYFWWVVADYFELEGYILDGGMLRFFRWLALTHDSSASVDIFLA